MTLIALVLAALTAREQQIAARVDAHAKDDVELLQKAVDIPSATENVAGVRAVGALFEAELKKIGFATHWVQMPPGMNRAGHLVGEIKGGPGKKLLLIGHLDTVVEGQKFARDGNKAKGVGGADMKGGDVIILAALRALREAGALEGRNLVVYFTGDEEEPGRPIEASRGDLVAIGKRSDAALAFEASVRDTATVARRGVSTWTLDVTAKTGHSAGIFDEGAGAGANFELARILFGLYAEVRGEKYLTFNPSLVTGGSAKTNVIAGKASATGDLRFLSNEQREHAKERFRAVVDRHLPKTGATIEFNDSYPAMSPTKGNYALLAVVDGASRDLGFGPVPALDPGERGAGDVSFVAPYVDSLDGLGARGSGSHTVDETVDLATLPELVKRTAILIDRLK